jgi:hypothetical protein
MRHVTVPLVLTLSVSLPVSAEPATPNPAGGKPVRILFVGNSYTFYMTWARQHIPDQQAEITKTYAGAARALLVPAGEAWKAAFAARPEIVLHDKDKSHPNPKGTYLTACVFYGAMTGESPVGLPAKIEAAGGGKKPVCDVPEEEAKLLQETAWKTVQQTRGP